MSDDSRFSILIVDDEKANLDVLNHILKQDYKIFIAKSGLAALKRAKEDKPDLILLDVLMPEMSGFDVLLQLKSMDETRNIPVIFITGLVSAEDEERGFFHGAVDYITKPFNNSIVRARIKTHLRIVKQMRTIEKLCMIDALTDIPNRRSFDTTLNAEWVKAIVEKKPIGLLMIDADKFKSYNDTYGHPQGDVLLQTLARVFTESLPSNNFVARVGGEEFSIVLPDCDKETLMARAEEIREKAQAEIVPAANYSIQTTTTISIGAISIIPTENNTISDFVNSCDAALYKAKETGRNKVCLAVESNT